MDKNVYTEFDGRKVLLRVLVGSHNYNLNTPVSDKDYKYFVLPIFDDFFYNKMYSKNVVSETEDYSVHDIRKIPHLLWKANLNFIEILYSKEFKYPHEKYASMNIVRFILTKRDELSTMNLPALFSASRGMSLQKQSQMLKDSPGKHANIEKYGYDTKSACHAARILDFLLRMKQYDMEVDRSFFYENDDPNRQLLLDIKGGKYNLADVQDIIKNKEEAVHKIEDVFMNHEPNTQLLCNLENAIKNSIRDSISLGQI